MAGFIGGLKSIGTAALSFVKSNPDTMANIAGGLLGNGSGESNSASDAYSQMQKDNLTHQQTMANAQTEHTKKMSELLNKRSEISDKMSKIGQKDSVELSDSAQDEIGGDE